MGSCDSAFFPVPHIWIEGTNMLIDTISRKKKLSAIGFFIVKSEENIWRTMFCNFFTVTFLQHFLHCMKCKWNYSHSFSSKQLLFSCMHCIKNIHFSNVVSSFSFADTCLPKQQNFFISFSRLLCYCFQRTLLGKLEMYFEMYRECHSFPTVVELNIYRN